MLSKGRDHGELQDMYRRALAASWAAQPGELPADQCIEDIFSGGDGWKDGYEQAIAPRLTHDENGSEEERNLHKHRRTHSNSSLKSQTTIKENTRIENRHSRSRDPDLPSGSQSPGDQPSSEVSERGRTGFRKAHEVDEFEMRDDLIAWRLPGKVSS